LLDPRERGDVHELLLRRLARWRKVGLQFLLGGLPLLLLGVDGDGVF
jgi:hypothetical protein